MKKHCFIARALLSTAVILSTLLGTAALAAPNSQTFAAVGSGGYNPCTIVDYLGDTISFDAARVTRTTVQLRKKEIAYPEGGPTVSLSPYQGCEVTLVTLQPGSRLTVSMAPVEEPGIDAGTLVQPNGNNKYTNFFHEIGIYFLDEETLKNDLQEYCVLITGATGFYLVGYENVFGNPVESDGLFCDVPNNAYYADAVKWSVEKGITNGTDAFKFSPGNTCTTAQILTFLWRANGSPRPASGNPFSNVPADAYYGDAVTWAKEKGLITGASFQDGPCTRAATVTYLWKLAGQPAPQGANPFTDVPGDARAVVWAMEQGITSGTSATTFAPEATCTRGQIVTFLHRYMAR